MLLYKYLFIIKEVMPQETKKDGVDSLNIFDDFSIDDELKKEVKQGETKREKNGIFYLQVFSNFFKGINLILGVFFIFAGSYVYIQNNEDFYDSASLDIICPLLLWDVMFDEWSCGSVWSMLSIYTWKEKTITQDYYVKILNSVSDAYSISNYLFSKEVRFLLWKTEDRLDVLAIISEFDKIKNIFEPINKWKIKCQNIEIIKSGVMKIRCAAFSSQWDGRIIGPSGKTNWQDTVYGTSISIASSFINYLEKKSNNFFVLEKPTSLWFEEIVGLWWYTRKTVFDITLQFKTTNISLLQ